MTAHNSPNQSLLDLEYRSENPLRTLLKLLRISPPAAAFYVLLFIIKGLPVFLMPLYLQWLVAYGTHPEKYDTTTFWLYTGGFALIILQNVPTHWWYTVLTHRHIRSLERKLRAALTRRLQQLSINYHTNSETGRLQSKVLRDVEHITAMVNFGLHNTIGAGLNLAWCLYLSFSQDWIIGLFFVTVAPLAAGLIYLFRTRMRQNNREYRSHVETMSSQVSEMLDTIPVTRAHGQEDEATRRTDVTLNQVYNAGMRVDKTNQMFAAANFVTMKLALGAVAAVTTWMVVYHGKSVDLIMLYFALFSIVVNSFNTLVGFLPVISHGMEAIRSVGEVLECPDLEYNAGKKPVNDVKGQITFENVAFSYKNAEHVRAIKHFNLDIQPGHCIAFVGASGSGKSTLMNLCIGFYRPQSGRILLDGIDASTLDLRTWRRHIAIVPQHTVLFNGTIRDNICYGLPSINQEQLNTAVEAANLTEVIANAPHGLETQVGENGMALSGGQRQRIAIARAIIRNPKIIILDEATSALDVISEKEVQVAIDTLIEGRTVLIVAHRLSTIRKADRIVVMKEGRCIEMGTEKELLAREHGEFTELKRLQA